MKTNGTKLSLLIVDDDPANRELIIENLSPLLTNLDIEQAQDGNEAIAHAENKLIKTHQSFDFIIMDYQMPFKNGQEATSTIRELENKHDIEPSKKSFIITWSAARSEPFEGADAIMSKPLLPNELKALFTHKD